MIDRTMYIEPDFDGERLLIYVDLEQERPRVFLEDGSETHDYDHIREPLWILVDHYRGECMLAASEGLDDDDDEGHDAAYDEHRVDDCMQVLITADLVPAERVAHLTGGTAPKKLVLRDFVFKVDFRPGPGEESRMECYTERRKRLEALVANKRTRIGGGDDGKALIADPDLILVAPVVKVKGKWRKEDHYKVMNDHNVARTYGYFASLPLWIASHEPWNGINLEANSPTSTPSRGLH